MKTIMESVREWLKTYSGLKERLDVDFLDDEAESYSVDTIPCPEVVKRYHDGSCVKQFQFAISSRCFYDQNIAQNLANLQFFSDFTEWVEERARKRELPEIDGNRYAQRIEVLSTAYPFIVSEDGKARYQTQMKLEYFQGRK